MPQVDHERYSNLFLILEEVIPGIRKALLICSDKNSSRGLGAYIAKFPYSEGESERLGVDNVLDDIEQARSGDRDYEWLLEDEVPFEEGLKLKGQIDIFTASRKGVLLLRLKETKDAIPDLLYLFISGTQEGENVKGIRKSLDETARSYIGLMAWRSIHRILKIQDQEVHHRHHFLEKTRESFELFRQERQNYKQTGKRYGESLLRLAETRLEEHSKRANTVFRLSDSASDMIMEYPGDLTNMLRQIDQAVEYVKTLYSGSQQNEIAIEDWFLELTPAKNKAESTDTGEVTQLRQSRGRLSKTSDLLDKLENAARNAKEKGLKITSANVGKMCPTPISAPAITDSIRNHRNRIVQLLKKHPDRWALIRNEFRPVLNALEPKEEKKESA